MEYIKKENKICVVNEKNEITSEITFYEKEKGTYDICYMFVDKKVNEKNIAENLIEMAIREIHRKDGKVSASFPYVKDYLDKKGKMILGVLEAKRTMNENKGGPFGAVIVKDNEVISIASNTVLESKDPTAHAEINAIRKASQKLDTYDLTGCTIYATGYPCPMCLSAIMWSNIKELYYGTDLYDAEEIGFRDEYIYHFIKDDEKEKKEATLKIKNIARRECLELFEEYSEKQKEIY